MRKIETAVILAGGLGTRMYPLTRAIPKELLPLGKLPILHHVIKEAVGAGIKRIVVVSSIDKPEIERYFEPPENYLEQVPTELAHSPDLNLPKFELNLGFQRKPGLQGAVEVALRFLPLDEDFVMMFPDDVFAGPYKETKRLIEHLPDDGYGSLCATLNKGDAHKYGVLTSLVKMNQDFLYLGTSIVEKPTDVSSFPEVVPTVTGRYVLNSDGLRKHSSYDHPINSYLNSLGAVYAVPHKHRRFDCGSMEGYVDAQRNFGTI